MSTPVEIELPALNNEPGSSQVATIENKRPEKRPFYFDDFQVVIQVDGQTYKIHRHFLTRESRYFKNLFSFPQPGDSASVEGSDNNPIKVPETPSNEFENLLRFFYFGMHDDYVASLADWIAMLSISTRLFFHKVRNRAIKEITASQDQVDPFELISLAVQCDVRKWLKPAFRRIVTRNELITHKEALIIPFPMTAMLMRSREQFWKACGSRDSIINSEIRVMEKASGERMSWPDSEIVTETASVATSEPSMIQSIIPKKKKKGKKGR